MMMISPVKSAHIADSIKPSEACVYRMVLGIGQLGRPLFPGLGLRGFTMQLQQHFVFIWHKLNVASHTFFSIL
jgi:hypothetical protein